MDHEFDLTTQDELLSERLTDDELHDVLERLGQQEFSLGAHSTVRDIVEGTGADPVAIGRALAEVRKQDFEERFASAFGDHEKRITELESKPPIGPRFSGPGFRTAVERALEEKRQEEELAKANREEFARQIRSRNNKFLFVFFCFLAAMVFLCQWLNASLFGPNTVQVVSPDGTTVYKTRDGKYDVRTSDGNFRGATEDEMELVDKEEAVVRHLGHPMRGEAIPPISPGSESSGPSSR